MNALPSPCTDCGMDTTPCTGKRGCRHKGRWEFFMVADALWAAHGAGDGYLCVACIERRMGRPLTPTDFTDAPCNEPDPWDTPRLAARKAGVVQP